MKRIGLLPRVLVAILCGIGCSLFFPLWATRIFVTFNAVFGNFLGMFIPVLIIGLVAPAIADIGKGAGRLLLATLLLAYLSTIASGLASYFVCRWSFPILIGSQAQALADIDMAESIAPYFTIEMPAFINVTTALVVAFILGLGCAAIPGNTMKAWLDDLKQIVMRTISGVIIPLLPIYIFGIFLKIGMEGHVAAVMGVFFKIIFVIIGLHVAVLLVQFLLAGAVSGKNPFRSLVGMFPAYLTALGTSSSAATIPVTLRCAKKLGVREQLADFTVPLCATIHLPCSILKLTACCFAISLSSGMPVDFGTYLGFILMLAVTMIAAPGVPGGAVMAALAVMSGMLGFDENMQGFVIAIYIALDSFGTAGNVTGDGAIALVMDKLFRKNA